MKVKLLSIEEIKNLKSGTKVWYDGTEIHEIGVIDSPYICNLYGQTLANVNNIQSYMKIYEWIEENNESNKFNNCMQKLENFILSSIPKQYYGDEIIKMIREGKLKEGDKLVGKYLDSTEFNSKFILEKDDTGLILKEILNDINYYTREIDYWTLINMIFTIKGKEYMSFDEARKTGKKFKYKTWNHFMDTNTIIAYLYMFLWGKVDMNNLFNEKAWEVED